MRAALVLLTLARLAVPAVATAAEPEAPPAGNDPAKALDPISLLVNSPDTWTVSHTKAGCFLSSPARNGSSSLAIGQHSKLGLGLFIVGFGLSVANANLGEPVSVQVEGRDLNEKGRLAGVRLLFIPMEKADVEASLGALKDTGSLWLMVRHTWITHSGLGVADAVAKYRHDCASAG